MATTTRRVDGSHPLSRFYGLLNRERHKAADAVRRDAEALRRLYEWGLTDADWRAHHLATARGCTDTSGKPVRWPRVWTRQDEKRFRHLYLGEGSTMPWARTVRLLKRIDGPDGGEPPRLRAYSEALYGSPKPLESRIVQAFETHQAFLEAVRLAAESGHDKVNAEEFAAATAVGELFDHLPSAKGGEST